MRTCVCVYAWSRLTLRMKVYVVELVVSQRKYAFTFTRDPSYFPSFLFTPVNFTRVHTQQISRQWKSILTIDNHSTLGLQSQDKTAMLFDRTTFFSGNYIKKFLAEGIAFVRVDQHCYLDVGCRPAMRPCCYYDHSDLFRPISQSCVTLQMQLTATFKNLIVYISF